jgi:hypothetical protein
MVQNNHFRPFRAPPNGPKKILKVPQVGGMSLPMSDLKNKPLTKSLGLFFLREIIQNNQKTAFSTVFGHFWHK